MSPGTFSTLILLETRYRDSKTSFLSVPTNSDVVFERFQRCATLWLTRPCDEKFVIVPVYASFRVRADVKNKNGGVNISIFSLVKTTIVHDSKN
jgi:hypothetical protein